jgi:hypothetical protein
VWATHADFWQKAMEDYSKEYMRIGRLAVGVTKKAAAAAQCATHEASAEVFPSFKAERLSNRPGESPGDRSRWSATTMQ